MKRRSVLRATGALKQNTGKVLLSRPDAKMSQQCSVSEKLFHQLWTAGRQIGQRALGVHISFGASGAGSHPFCSPHPVGFTHSATVLFFVGVVIILLGIAPFRGSVVSQSLFWRQTSKYDPFVTRDADPVLRGDQQNANSPENSSV
jgi:hypothetical protein